MKSPSCKCCGQPLVTRHGVKLTAKKLEIYDAIKASGARGIVPKALADIVYPRDREGCLFRIRSHICQINALLEHSDWRIRRDCGRYRLIREIVEAAA